MRSKPTMYIAILASILALYAFVFVYPSLTKEADFYILSKFNVEDAAKMELSYNGMELVFNKKGDSWYIASADNYPAEYDTISNMISDLSDLKSSSVIASGEYDKYGLDDDNVSKVKVYDVSGNVLASVSIGTQGASFRYMYVSVEGDDNVYYARMKNQYSFKFINNSFFKDKMIVRNIEAEDIKRVQSTFGGFDVIYSSGNGTGTTWVDVEGNSVDSAKVNEYLAAMMSVRAEDFVEEDIEFDTTQYIKLYNDVSGSSELLVIYIKEKDGQSYLKTNLREEVYMINPYYKDKLMSGLIQ